MVEKHVVVSACLQWCEKKVIDHACACMAGCAMKLGMHVVRINEAK